MGDHGKVQGTKGGYRMLREGTVELKELRKKERGQGLRKGTKGLQEVTEDQGPRKGNRN